MKFEKIIVPQSIDSLAHLHMLPAVLGWQVDKSQHSPVAQDAFECSIQVEALQQGLLHLSFSPQSHCSPGSTNPLPQTGLSNNLQHEKLTELPITLRDLSISQLFERIICITSPVYFVGNSPSRARMPTPDTTNCMSSNASVLYCYKN